MYQILVINPGSTSTKIALYEDKEQLWKESIDHSPAELAPYPTIFDQLEMRTKLVKKCFLEHGGDQKQLSAVMARGGLLPPLVEEQTGRELPIQSGGYRVTPKLIETIRTRPVTQHASNLGCAIAYQIAEETGIPAYIYDPVTVDELIDVVRVTGLKEITRKGEAHNLNMRAMAMRCCEERHREYAASNILVAHLGGGCSLSLHCGGRIVDILSDDEGPFSPERAGRIPAYLLTRKICGEKLEYREVMKTLQHGGGFVSYFGTSDSREVEKMALGGNKEAAQVMEAMALSVARGLAWLAVVASGKIDYIILTGGLAFSTYFTEMIKRYAGFLGEIIVMPGENEMQALANGGFRILTGQEAARAY